MRKRLGLLLVLVLPVVAASVMTWQGSKSKTEFAIYKGMTAAGWERELKEWEPIQQPWNGIWADRPPKAPWSHFPPMPIWRRFMEWTGILSPLPASLMEYHDLPAGLEADAVAVPVLTDMLGSDDPKVRWAAVQALGMIEPRSSEIVGILTSALTDPDKRIREDADRAFVPKVERHRIIIGGRKKRPPS
jgi:hypothetical protein